MNELIERKNKMLRDMADRMEKVSDIAKLLKEAAYLPADAKQTLMELTTEKLAYLSQVWTDAHFESNISEPEAVQYED